MKNISKPKSRLEDLKAKEIPASKQAKVKGGNDFIGHEEVTDA